MFQPQKCNVQNGEGLSLKSLTILAMNQQPPPSFDVLQMTFFPPSTFVLLAGIDALCCF